MDQLLLACEMQPNAEPMDAGTSDLTSKRPESTQLNRRGSKGRRILQTSAAARTTKRQKLTHVHPALLAKGKFESEYVPEELLDEFSFDEPSGSMGQIHTPYQTSRIFPFIRISARALASRKNAEGRSEGRGNSSNQDSAIHSWEKAAGAKNAEDILLGIDRGVSHQEDGRAMAETGTLQRDPLECVPSEPSPGCSQSCIEKLTDVLEYSHVKPELGIRSLEGAAVESGDSFYHEVKQEVDDEFAVEEEAEEMDKSSSEDQSGEATSADGAWMCPIVECQVGFDVFSSLETHMLLQHQNQPPIWCQFCPKTYRIPSSYVAHMKQTHKVTSLDKNKCDECGRSFATTSSYQEHCERFEGQTHFHCEPCNTSLPNADRKSHQQSKGHRISTNTWNPHPDPCTECEKTFRWAAHLQYHLKIYKDIPHFFCKPCNLVVNKQDNLHHEWSKKHRAKMNNPTETEDPQFNDTCEECGKVFFQRNNSNRHFEAFEGLPHFYCEPCKLTVRTSDKEKHERSRRHKTVTGEYEIMLHRWKCLVRGCEAAFPYKRELDEHAAVHRIV